MSRVGLDTKSRIFLALLEHQEIFLKFWGFLEKMGFWGIVRLFGTKIVLCYLPFYLKFL